MNERKLKNNKGITLISLIITIAVMFIVAGTTVYISLDRFEINRLKKMYNDIELLSDKVANYYLKYNGLPVIKDSENNAIEYTYTPLNFDKNINDSGSYYILDLEAMEGISLNYGKEGYNNPNTSDDVYIINKASHVIYYVKGIELDGEMYYTIPKDENSISDTIPPTKPEIKVISGTLNSEGEYTSNVELEIIPGKDNWSEIEKTTYTITYNSVNGEETVITTNKILKITEDGTYTIKARTYDINGNVSEYTTEIIIRNKDRAFISQWNVTLGETEGSDTYSTVVLPVNTKSSYNATIYWGDGTNTILQHNTNGITLTDEELIEKVTHNYTLAENDDALRTIEIGGTYSDFRMNSSTSTPTKLKLTSLEQWGNVKSTNINFENCTNLTGMIPNNDLIELNASSYFFSNTGITGLEEGFCFSGGTDWRFMFQYCSNLKYIPSSFKIINGVTSTWNMFARM